MPNYLISRVMNFTSTVDFSPVCSTASIPSILALQYGLINFRPHPRSAAWINGQCWIEEKAPLINRWANDLVEEMVSNSPSA